MSRFNKAFSVFAVAILGLWGCAKGPDNTKAHLDRIRTLETKYAQLEESYRSVAVDRDQASTRVTSLEQDKSKLEEQFRLAVKERDRLREDVEMKTSERDLLQVRCDKMKTSLKVVENSLKEALTEDDGILATPPSSNRTSVTAAAPR